MRRDLHSDEASVDVALSNIYQDGRPFWSSSHIPASPSLNKSSSSHGDIFTTFVSARAGIRSVERTVSGRLMALHMVS